jgi:hypothetical protein
VPTPAEKLSQAEALLRVAETLRGGGTLQALYESGSVINVATGQPYSYRQLLRFSKMKIGEVIDLAATTKEEYRAEKLAEWAQLKRDLENPNIRPDRKIELMLAITDRECKLLGLNAAEQLEITGPQLNPLFLAIAKAMADVPEEDQQKVLDFAATLVRPITLDASCFPPFEPLQLPEGAQ